MGDQKILDCVHIERVGVAVVDVGGEECGAVWPGHEVPLAHRDGVAAADVSAFDLEGLDQPPLVFDEWFDLVVVPVHRVGRGVWQAVVAAGDDRGVHGAANVDVGDRALGFDDGVGRSCGADQASVGADVEGTEIGLDVYVAVEEAGLDNLDGVGDDGASRQGATDQEVAEVALVGVVVGLEADDAVGVFAGVQGPEGVGPVVVEGQAVEADPTLAAVGGTLYYDNKFQLIQNTGSYIDFKFSKVFTRGDGELEHGQFSQFREVDFICGAAILLRAKAIEEIGICIA